MPAGTFAKAWSAATPPAELAGLGPFVLQRIHARPAAGVRPQPALLAHGARTATPCRISIAWCWRSCRTRTPSCCACRAAPRDFTQDALRPDDYVPVKRLEQQGTLKMQEIGVGTDADALWFCLKPEVRRKDPRWAFVQQPEFRQALSHAVDREEFAQTVFLGEAVPIWGPVTPGNKQWFSPNVPRYPLRRGQGQGAAEVHRPRGPQQQRHGGGRQRAPRPASRVLTQQGLTWYERGTIGHARRGGQGGHGVRHRPAGDRRHGAAAADLRLRRHLHARARSRISIRPANLDFWLSSGEGAPLEHESKTPATEWEARIDQLMARAGGHHRSGSSAKRSSPTCRR